MNMNRLRLGLCWLCLCLASPVWSQPIAIVGGTIIDGNGGPPIKGGVLVIEDQRIVAVGDRRTPIPETARIIQAKNKTIIPGLMDANVHLLFQTLLEVLLPYEDDYEALITEAAQIALKNGVTTVFDSWGPRQALVNVRNGIRAGEIIGSRIYLAGNIVGYDGPLSPDFEVPPVFADYIGGQFLDRTNAKWEQGVGRELLWMSPEQVRQAIRGYIKKDIDFVKYTASGHSMAELDLLAFSPAVQAVLVAEAHGAGLTVQSHTSSVESLRLAIEAGVDLLQHCEVTGATAIPAATIELMKDRQVACTTLPMSQQREAYLRRLQPALFADDGAVATSNDNIETMIRAGVTLLLSTDAGVTQDGLWPEKWAPYQTGVDKLTKLGEGHFIWLKAMNEKGMAPMDALLAATRNIARAYNIDADLGTLEVGKLADLLILDKNPLQDPAHYRRIHLVMKAGQIIDRGGLPQERILSRADAGRE